MEHSPCSMDVLAFSQAGQYFARASLAGLRSWRIFFNASCFAFEVRVSFTEIPSPATWSTTFLQRSVFFMVFPPPYSLYPTENFAQRVTVQITDTELRENDSGRNGARASRRLARLSACAAFPGCSARRGRGPVRLEDPCRGSRRIRCRSRSASRRSISA